MTLYCGWFNLMHGMAPDNTYEASTHKNMFLVGFTTSLNGLLIVFASPTTRTPGFLQALMVNVTYVRRVV